MYRTQQIRKMALTLLICACVSSCGTLGSSSDVAECMSSETWVTTCRDQCESYNPYDPVADVGCSNTCESALVNACSFSNFDHDYNRVVQESEKPETAPEN